MAAATLPGVVVIALGVSGLVRPWVDVSRLVVVAQIGLGALNIGLFFWYFQYFVHRIEGLPDGHFRMVSRHRERVIGPGVALSLWLERVRTTQGPIWISRLIDDGVGFEIALLEANPNLKVTKGWLPPPSGTISDQAADRARDGFPFG